jgi:hypothetical protein
MRQYFRSLFLTWLYLKVAKARTGPAPDALSATRHTGDRAAVSLNCPFRRAILLLNAHIEHRDRAEPHPWFDQSTKPSPFVDIV